jgi:SAM-dependent methyltransferase
VSLELPGEGPCPVCGASAAYREVAPGGSLRERRCPACGSARRTRDLARALLRLLAPGLPALPSALPALGGLRAYEAQAGGPLHAVLSRLPRYVCSEYVPEAAAPGRLSAAGIRCEDLQALTFEDGSFDLVVTQDVLEHVADPWRAFAEIFRVLAPGGLHLFTVPLNPGHPTTPRAERVGGEVRQLLPPVHHGDPVRQGGSLVFTDFGDDLPARLGALGQPTGVASRAGLHGPDEVPWLAGGQAYQDYLRARAEGRKASFLRYDSVVLVTRRPPAP